MITRAIVVAKRIPKQKQMAMGIWNRTFHDGDTLYLEPWRAKAFPVIRDLVVDRNAFERILQAGGFVTGSRS